MARPKWKPVATRMALTAGALIIYSATAAAATASLKLGFLPIAPGQTVEFTLSAVGCPTKKGLQTLESDAGNHDRVGFYKHLDASGCLSIPRGSKGVVIGEQGMIDPWFRVRLAASGKAFWLDDMRLVGPKGDKPSYVLWHWLPFRVGETAVTTTNWQGCAAGLDNAPVAEMASWEKKNCYKIPVGTRLKVIAVGNARQLRDSGLFNFGVPVFAFWWHGKRLWMESDSFFDVARVLTNH